ncbi:MAG TPA: peptide deformylase [Blastocatellia bacterium]|nr:peptide deformylase [Blastocatellia bacterium]
MLLLHADPDATPLPWTCMELVTYPDPILFKRSEPVEITKELRDFIDRMGLFMKNELTWGKPVGLAAPQVGRSVRVFIALDQVYINPELTFVEEAGTAVHEEGCYSLERDRFDYKVTRHNEIVLQWQNRKGKHRQERITGFRAQVIQHEYDHLEGRLCCGEPGLLKESNSSAPPP